MRKLGLIAGGGGLPLALAESCAASGRPIHVIRLEGFAGPELTRFPGEPRGLLDLDGGIAALKRAGCEAVCFAGTVGRPDFQAEGAALPPDIVAAGGADDALLRAVEARFRAEGFTVEGAQEVMAGLTLNAGPVGRLTPSERDLEDIARAAEVARAIGALDVGQGAVCRDGLVLAVEAQEGTDAMLGRAGALIAQRGLARPSGVLVKTSKPGQTLRLDLPTIGPQTLRLAAEAGLAGVAGEAGRVLVVERAETVRLADDLGLFLFGIG